MMLTKKFICPMNNTDCPYWEWEDENGKQYDVQELLEKGYHFVNGEPVTDLFTSIRK